MLPWSWAWGRLWPPHQSNGNKLWVVSDIGDCGQRCVAKHEGFCGAVCGLMQLVEVEREDWKRECVKIGLQSEARRIDAALKKILSNIEHSIMFPRIYLRPQVWWRRAALFRVASEGGARSNSTGRETREKERLWSVRVHQAC